MLPGQVFTHRPTGHSVGFSTAEMHSAEPAQKMVAYNEHLAAHHAHATLQECVRVQAPTEKCEKAAAVVERLMRRSSFQSDGLRWAAKDAELGNILAIGDTRIGTGFQDYEGVLGEDGATVERKRKLQRDHTLRILRTGYNKLVQKRDSLAKAGLGIDDLDALLAAHRPGAAFALACTYLLDQMATGHELVDLHFVDSANGLAAFGWHIDDHAEKDKGRPKKYIERSVACQCSRGLTSMTIAGLPACVYPGVGGFVDFPAWALHRTSRRGEGATMWKLVGFFEP